MTLTAEDIVVIQQIADQRIQLVIPSSPTTVKKRGTVDLVDTASRTFSAFLDGASVSTPGIPYKGVPVPSTGDAVEVDVRLEDGYMSAVVVGRDFDVPTLDTSGFVTDEELADHVDDPVHLTQYTTPIASTGLEGYWTLIAYGDIPLRYGQFSGTILVSGNGSATNDFTRGIIRFRVRQQAAFGSNPLVMVELLNGAELQADDVALVVTDNGGPTHYELYVRLDQLNEWLTFVPLIAEAANATHFWVGCSALQAALPAGTKFYGDRPDVAVAIRPLKADISTSSSSFQDATGLSFDVIAGAEYTFALILYYDVGNVNTGIAVGFNFPGSANLRASVAIASAGPVTYTEEQVTAANTATGTTTTDNTSVSRKVKIEGRFNADTAGTFQVRYKRQGTSSTVSIQKGSGGWYVASRAN